MLLRTFAAGMLIIGLTSTAYAQKPETQPDMGTSEQRAACGSDVSRYCKSVKPEEGPAAYLACLQENKAKLKPACLKIIEPQ
jgi:hypothetical protein